MCKYLHNIEKNDLNCYNRFMSFFKPPFFVSKNV